MSRRAGPAPWRDALAIGLGVGVFGITFGVLATTAGLSVPQTSAMSLFVFTGASQFAAVAVIDAGGSGVTALGSAFLLASRNAIYGVSMARIVRGSLARRLVAAQLVVDESTAMAAAQDDDESALAAFWATGISMFAFWNAGTLVGALGGNAIGDPATLGLDAAFPAGFIALLAPQVRMRPAFVAALAGGVIALATVPFLPVGAPILLAALGAVVGLFVRGRPEDPP